MATASVSAVTSAAWLGIKAAEINAELGFVRQLVPDLQKNIAANDTDEAASTLERLRRHTAAAKNAADDPVWTLASTIPGIGPNLSAVSEVARSADDVVNLGLTPLVQVYNSLDWEALLPNSAGTDLEPFQAASPKISSAADTIRRSADRLSQIETSRLLPQVADPLRSARDQLQSLTGALDAAADASSIAPSMLGAESTRSYLLMVQNNAEVRASGGIPGALAVINFEDGKMTLGAQSTAGAVGATLPIVPLDIEQEQIYTRRMGKFMQDVNLTPDFPTSASIAQAMWERKTGQRVDGVVSVDPIALSYILAATGPVNMSDPELVTLAGAGLPAELNENNIVKTLLTDVYAQIESPELQDAYFAGVAQKIFATLAEGRGSGKEIVESIARGTSEGRVLLWSAVNSEQGLIDNYALSGAISGPSVSPAQFGVYFNDGTGAKMDVYVRRTVQLVKECARDGYEETTVRVTNVNTAPADAALVLPPYVTGDGIYGVPAGSVQTNITAYGPTQANVETATINGQRTGFAPYIHSGRPVGIVAVLLAPGESRTVEFTFGKIAQHTEPSLAVTPTVQPVDDVILPTKKTLCG